MQSFHKQGILRFLLLWLASYLVLISFFLKDTLASDNIVEIFPSELALPFFMHLVTGLIAAAAIYFCKWPRSLGAKFLSLLLLSLLLSSYNTRLEQIVPVFKAFLPVLPAPPNDIAFISLIFIALLFFISVMLGRFIEKLQSKYTSLQNTNIIVGSLIVIGVVFFGQAIRFTTTLPDLLAQSKVQPKSLASDQKPINTLKPDIFYIVLDRYTNNQVLRNQLGFDNSTFTNHLTNNGFVVSDNAHSNYPYTATSLASTLNADYTNQLVTPFKQDKTQSRTLYHNLVKQSSVVSTLKRAGYQYYSIGSWYGASNDTPHADKEFMWSSKLTTFGNERKLHGFEEIQFRQSIYYRLSQVSGLPLWPIRYVEQAPPQDIRTQLATLENIATKEPAGGRFIFAHILVPHDPFLFNADGSLNSHPQPDNIGALNKTKYLNQVEFINQQMMHLVDKIQKQSNGQAVILLNADEGAYPQVLLTSGLQASPSVSEGAGVGGDDMKAWPKEWLDMKYGILQAIRIPKATPDDLANISSVNLFRIVLNQYAGTNLPYLPNCNFGFTQGSLKQYIYRDITNEVQGTPNPACKQYESLP
jgi:hypothetical protein